MNKLTLIARENIPLVVGHVQRELERGLAEGNGEYVLEDLVDALREGRSQLWLGHGGVVDIVLVTTVESFPRQKRLRLELVAGKDFERYMEFLPELESFGRRVGAKCIVSFCRPGLAKLSKKVGFEVKGIQVSKEL